MEVEINLGVLKKRLRRVPRPFTTVSDSQMAAPCLHWYGFIGCAAARRCRRMSRLLSAIIAASDGWPSWERLVTNPRGVTATNPGDTRRSEIETTTLHGSRQHAYDTKVCAPSSR